MNNKLPWMPLDIPAYRNDTSHLTTLQHGGYMLMLMHYWCQGPLPDDDDQLAAIARMDAKTWRANRKTLRQFFSICNGELHQKRADVEREKAADISAKRRAAAGGRWNTPPNGHANASAKAPPNGSANGHPDADPDASHTVPSTVQTEEVREKESKSLKNLTFSPNLREGSDGEKPPRIDRSDDDDKLSDDPALAATIRRMAQGCKMTIPYAEVRSVQEQIEALDNPQPPVALVADAGLPPEAPRRYQPHEPVRTVAEQLAILRGEQVA